MYSVYELVACLQPGWEKYWTFIIENKLLKFILKSRRLMPFFHVWSFVGGFLYFICENDILKKSAK